VRKIKFNSLKYEVITKDVIMDILGRFERRAIEAIETDRKIKADNYESVGQYKLIKSIRKTIERQFYPPPSKSSCTIDNLLKPGNLWD